MFQHLDLFIPIFKCPSLLQSCPPCTICLSLLEEHCSMMARAVNGSGSDRIDLNVYPIFIYYYWIRIGSDRTGPEPDFLQANQYPYPLGSGSDIRSVYFFKVKLKAYLTIP